jgi:flavin reductase (DIM6/NTAB) family NADH-FMN oxidoreductase RutF
MAALEPAYPGSIFSLTDHELYVVSARDGDRENGQIATWIMPATLVPGHPRIAAVLSPQNYTHTLIAASGMFALSMLRDDQADLVPLFGLVSGRDIDKFDGLALARTPAGLPVLVDSCGWVECRIASAIDAGDRMLYLADVTAQQVFSTPTPLRKRAAFAAQSDEIRTLLEEKHRRDGARDASLLREFM